RVSDAGSTEVGCRSQLVDQGQRDVVRRLALHHVVHETGRALEELGDFLFELLGQPTEHMTAQRVHSRTFPLPDQYRFISGSTSWAKASIPPRRFSTRSKPLERSSSQARRLRPPVRQCTTMSRPRQGSSSAKRASSCPSGISCAPGMRAISASKGSRT